MTTYLYEFVNTDDMERAISDGLLSRRYHPEFPELAIVGYTEKAQFDRVWTPTTKALRGVIYNTETGEVLARPFSKFFNYGDDTHGQDLDPNRPILGAWDKADGSLGIQYLRPDGRAAIATRGSFESDQAIHATKLLQEDARYSTFKEVTESNFLLGVTWLWEIVYPENRIVLDYHGRDELILLGSVWHRSGAYVPPTDSLSERDFTVKRLPATTLGEALALPDRTNAEGMVIWFDEFTPIKLKQDDYVALHRIVSSLNVKEVWRQLSAGTYREFVEALPDEFHEWARETSDVLMAQYRIQHGIANRAFGDLRSLLPDRKAFAEQAKQWGTVRPLLFLLADGRDIAPAIWKSLEPKGANGEL